jgi:glycosyltransferase involved in cell wall biosynthesis
LNLSVIHLSFDFPDAINGRKTKAVKTLIESQQSADHIVFSLNRSADFFKPLKMLKESHGYSLTVRGLPYGVILAGWMFLASKRILAILKRDRIKPDLIHAHKLTFEGIIAFFMSKALNVPYIVTVRGNSDLMVLRHKPLYRAFYKRIADRAEKLVFLAPWPIKPLKKFLGETAVAGKQVIIPNIVPASLKKGVTEEPNHRFITAFHFNGYKGKNIQRVIKAFEPVFDKFPECGLDIAGSGPNEKIIRTCVQSNKYPERIRLLGNIDNETLLKLYSRYTGFILPSYPETFGLVFIEALAGGIPVIYALNAGIDGFFDRDGVGIGVNHDSTTEMTAAIESLIVNNDEFKRNIEKMFDKGVLERFSADAVGRQYSEMINTIRSPVAPLSTTAKDQT